MASSVALRRLAPRNAASTHPWKLGDEGTPLRGAA
jgi:hypothetical protein